jgi:hypothetical protein
MELSGLNTSFVDSLVAEFDACEYWHETLKIAEKYKGKEIFEDLITILEAFDYTLAMGAQHPNKPYSPMIQIGNKQYPEPFETISELKFGKWIEACNVFSESLVLTARIADLIWVNKKSKQPYEYALKAHASLLQISSEKDWQPIYKSSLLARAYAIAKELKKPDLLENTKKVSVELVKNSLDATENEAGVILTQLEFLTENLDSENESQLALLLNLAEKKFSGDPFLVSQVLSLQILLIKNDPQEVERIQRKLVDTWYQAGKGSVGLVKLNHLQKALELATKFRLTTLSREIRVEFESAGNSEDLGLQEIRSNIEIPREKFDSYIQSFFASANQKENLRFFASHRPLDGDIAKATEFALEIMRKYPLQSAFGTTLVKDGLPFYIANDAEGHLKLNINRNESMKIMIWGDIAARILERLLPNGPISEQILREYLADNEFISEADESLFEKCYKYLMEEKYEEVVLLGCARIEKVLRILASNCQIPVYNFPYGLEFGSYKTLGSILEALSPAMNRGSLMYLTLLLNDQGSLNLRNEHYHGLRDSTTKLDAILIFHAMLHVAAFRVTNEAP